MVLGALFVARPLLRDRDGEDPVQVGGAGGDEVFDDEFKSLVCYDLSLPVSYDGRLGWSTVQDCVPHLDDPVSSQVDRYGLQGGHLLSSNASRASANACWARSRLMLAARRQAISRVSVLCVHLRPPG